MKMKILIIIAIFLVMIPWIKGLEFDINNQVIVDGITTSFTVVMILTVMFSLLSWVLFSWASKNIPLIGIPLSIITGTSLLIPFSQVLGPMAGIILGIVAGFTAFMLQKKIINSAQNTSLIIAVITIVITYFILSLIILTIPTPSHEWDTGYGIGAWTGTEDYPEVIAFYDRYEDVEIYSPNEEYIRYMHTFTDNNVITLNIRHGLDYPEHEMTIYCEVGNYSVTKNILNYLKNYDCLEDQYP